MSSIFLRLRFAAGSGSSSHARPSSGFGTRCTRPLGLHAVDRAGQVGLDSARWRCRRPSSSARSIHSTDSTCACSADSPCGLSARLCARLTSRNSRTIACGSDCPVAVHLACEIFISYTKEMRARHGDAVDRAGPAFARRAARIAAVPRAGRALHVGGLARRASSRCSPHRIAMAAARLAPGPAARSTRPACRRSSRATPPARVHAHVNACRHCATPPRRRALPREGDRVPVSRLDLRPRRPATSMSRTRTPFPGPRPRATSTPSRCAERHGLVWLGAADVAGYLGPLDDELAALDLARHVACRESHTTRACNWKLVIEAFLDGYHIRDAPPRFHLPVLPRRRLRGRARGQSHPRGHRAPHAARCAASGSDPRSSRRRRSRCSRRRRSSRTPTSSRSSRSRRSRPTAPTSTT